MWISFVYTALLPPKRFSFDHRECDFSLYEVYGADEAFCTGTFSGVMPVAEVDGRKIGHGLAHNWADGADPPLPGPMVQRLQKLYLEKVVAECGGL